MIRERVNFSDPYTHVWVAQDFNCDGSQHGAPGSLGFSSSLQREYILDETGARGVTCGKQRRIRMSPVLHWKDVLRLPEGAFTHQMLNCSISPAYDGYRHFDSGAAMGWMCGLNSDMIGMCQALAISEFPSDPSNHYERWLRGKPTMASRANLAVFLYELRDLKRMFELLPRKHFTLRNWREVLKYGNDLHLNFNFGWKPFLRDVYSVMKGLDSFERRLYLFVLNADVDLTRHVGESEISSNYTKYGCPGGFPYYTWDQTWSVSAKFFSTFHFRYSVPYDYGSLRWRSYLDTLGLNASVTNIWAVIPWSFVIDWFVNIGPVLTTFNGDWVQPWIYFCQACTSAKYKVELTADVNYGPHPVSPGYVYDVNQWSYTLSHYSRSVGLPSAAFDDRSALSADKIRLLASLVAGQVL